MARRIYVLRRPGSKLDANGQPIKRVYNAPRIADRCVDELVGVCKALAIDGKISEEELGYLQRWLNEHQHAIDVWPANILVARINEILEDSIPSEEELRDLFELIAEIVGQHHDNTPTNLSIALPLTKPAPPVFFTNQGFCVTGRFVMGPRTNIEYGIRERGGVIHSNVTTETNYLIIGTIGSRDWLHSTHGRKIEKAVSYAERGHPIAIISEEHWADHLL